MISDEYLKKIKGFCDIHESITVYDEQLKCFIEDARAEMIESGVTEELANSEDNDSITLATTYYVKSNLEYSQMNQWLSMFRKKVVRVVIDCLANGGDTDVE